MRFGADHSEEVGGRRSRSYSRSMIRRGDAAVAVRRPGDHQDDLVLSTDNVPTVLAIVLSDGSAAARRSYDPSRYMRAGN